MEFLAPALMSAMVLPLLLISAVPLFIYIYAIVRWRAGTGGEPGIGSYALVLMFRLFAALLGLSAIALLLYAMLSSDEHEDLTRVCWPVLVASLLFLAVQFVIGTTLAPTDRYAVAKRIFGGGFVAVSGFLTFASLVALLVTKWQKTPDDPDSHAAKQQVDMLKAFGSWLFCFGAVYIASALRMARSVPTGLPGRGGPTPP
jgi:heme A synthase